ncbi:hypothetical protein WK59_13255 [Burkholderia ubonensis]|uniref:ABC transporter substrate-binding protein n=1 Tax=Burkholderia ubonensis TaxID=101571 RepID=UPI00075CB1DA|nr:ABC transporter substrate-binding protein [Burkholderia ubonensis]KVD30154.1 hypothetical protein WI84_26070 [Burkholderia ubonensis]KVT84423.1 hypothetical protein WK59_13255 [Burkholderia ubonensis]
MAAALSVFAGAALGADNDVSVMHYWTSGGEAAAVAKLKEALASRGVQWHDIAVGGGDNEKVMLKTRFTKNDPPDAALVANDIRPYAVPGVVADLGPTAKQGNWDAVLPAVLRSYAKAGGAQYAMVPVNAARDDTMYFSMKGLKAIGATQAPHNWDELFAMADKAKQAGLVPIAGAGGWTINYLFYSVAFSTLGADGYRSGFETGNPAVLGGAGMVRAFDLLRRIKQYTDPSAISRKWNEATQMVIQGKALMQFQGDWAKGEFLSAGQQPGRDFVCGTVPNADQGVLFNTDAFIFFKTKKSRNAAQVALAAMLMDRQVQTDFNLVKGSLPARLDADVSKYDTCGQASYAQYVAASKNGKLVVDAAQLVPAGRINAWNDVIQQFWNNDGMTSAQAAQRMQAVADRK